MSGAAWMQFEAQAFQILEGIFPCGKQKVIEFDRISLAGPSHYHRGFSPVQICGLDCSSVSTVSLVDGEAA
jgi:hypothetical protein